MPTIAAVSRPQTWRNLKCANGFSDFSDFSCSSARRSARPWAAAYVKASNTGVEDWFGYSVALSEGGTVMAVSARLEDSAATGVGGDQGSDLASQSGAVYVFRRSDSAWAQEAYVKASNTDADDRFGESVALSADGGVLAVGATLEDSAATGVGGDEESDLALDSGAAYVFRFAGGAWAQETYVKASNGGLDDWFGGRVGLSANGSALAVAAYTEDSAATGVDGDQGSDATSNSGAVYVYR
ncbi:MAG: FG-GAP repeat protein [Deltaproteobacteria bacterium]|nr:FG-GAP repeat protein [Deltaproteobacteria bacterium]